MIRMLQSTCATMFALLLLLSLAGIDRAEAGQVIQLKYAVSAKKGVPVTDSALVFAEEVNKRSGGTIVVRVFDNGPGWKHRDN